MNKEKVHNTPFWRFLFLLYCGTMLWLLFGRVNGWTYGVPYFEQLRRNNSLIPFYTISRFLYVLRHPTNAETTLHCFINLAGNILLFIPAGWLIPKLWTAMQGYFRFFALCFAGIFLVEVLQLFTLLGVFDVDDIILNLFGLSLGFVFYKVCYRK